MATSPVITDQDVFDHAAAAAEAIRAINHLTIDAAALPYGPPDVYRVLGSLMTMAQRLPQTLEQLEHRLVQCVQADQVAVDYEPHRDDPIAAIGEASHALLREGRVAARRLAAALEQAQQAISGASYIGPDDNKNPPA